MFNSAVETVDSRDWDMGVKRCTSTNDIFINHLETVSHLYYSKARAAMDVWPFCSTETGISASKRAGTTKNGGRYLLSGQDWFLQTGHNDFEHTRKANLGYFMQATGTREKTMWACTGTHKLLFSSGNEKILSKNCKDIGTCSMRGWLKRRPCAAVSQVCHTRRGEP